MRIAIALAAATATAGLLAGCGDGGGSDGSEPERSGVTPPASTPAEPQTVTAPPPTVTVTPSPVTTAPPTTTTVAPPVSASPVGVLSAYFAAVNARDYASAWELGGETFASSYAEFVDDHATKANYDLTVVSVDGPTVEATMDVTRTDGGHEYYQGTYTVHDGVITGTTMSERTPATPTAPDTDATPTTPPGQGSAYYENCSDVREAGKAPIHRGEPGYSSDLDRDGDGVGCEPYEPGD